MIILECNDNTFRVPTKYWEKIKKKLANFTINYIKELYNEWSIEEENIKNKKYIKICKELFDDIKSTDCKIILLHYEDFLIDIGLYGIIQIIDKPSENGCFSIGNALDIYHSMNIIKNKISINSIIYSNLMNFFENSVIAKKHITII